MQMLVSPGGEVRCLYNETLDLNLLGKLTISRGSYVEPVTDGSWFAYLSPVAGPALGPFSLRSDALAAEVEWLETYWLK